MMKAELLVTLSDYFFQNVLPERLKNASEILEAIRWRVLVSY